MDPLFEIEFDRAAPGSRDAARSLYRQLKDAIEDDYDGEFRYDGSPLQTGVAAFIAEGHLAHHVRRMRGIYRKRRQTLIDMLRRDFASWLEPALAA